MTEEELPLSPEEISRMARAMADALAGQPSIMSQAAVTCVTISIDDIDLDAVASSCMGITDILGQIAQWFSSLLNTIASWIVSAVTGFIDRVVMPGIRGISDWLSRTLPGIGQALAGIPAFISQSVIPALSSVASFLTVTLPSYFTGVINFFTKTLPSYFTGVTDFFGKTLPTLFTGVIDFFTKTLPSYFTGVIDFFTKTLPSYFTGVIDFFTRTLPQFFGGVVDFFAKTLPSFFSGVVDFFTRTLPSFFEYAVGFFTKTLPSFFEHVIGFFTRTLPSFFEHVVGFFTRTLPSFFEYTSVFFTKTLPSFFEYAVGFFTKTLPSFFEYVTGFFTKVMPLHFDFVSRFFTITLPGWINQISGGVNEFLDTLYNLPKKVPDIFGKMILTVAKSIYELFVIPIVRKLRKVFTVEVVDHEVVPERVEEEKGWEEKALDPIKDAFTISIESHEPIDPPDPPYIASVSPRWAIPVYPDIKIFADPFKWLLEKIIDPFAMWIQSVGEKIWSGIKWLWDTLVSVFRSVAETVWGAVRNFASWLWDSIVNAFKTIGETLFKGIMSVVTAIGEAVVRGLSALASGILNIARTVAEALGRAVTEFASLVLAPIFNTFSGRYAERVVGITEMFAKSSSAEEDLGYLFGGIWLIVQDVILAHALGYGISHGLQALASVVDDLEVRPQALLEGEGGCALEPIGLGARLRALLGWLISLGWHFKPSYILREMGKDVRLIADEFTKGLMYGITIWSTSPIAKLLNAALRDVLVVELPSIDTMQEIVRRHMPSERFEEVLRDYRVILKLYGYRTGIIEWLTSMDLKIEVTDRFGTKRIVPISMMYELPSASDVAAMMVRDIFASVGDFQKLYLARGMHPDVGALYYFLRFKYPPPERLWQFTVRGISGLLWATVTDTEMAEVRREIEPLKALMPVAPEKLNFKADQLLSAFKTYMKWHDYFRGAWIQGFTSDNLIYIDTLADIPSKIDQRWMVKWGVYELLSGRQVTIQSPVREFAVKILDSNPASGITMDLTNFSRTLLATGLHPDWVPATAVAEAMNALTEERTLLRSGFVSLFKEGFYNIKALETLLAGFIKTSFHVAYFDMTKMQWTTGWVNIPVMYLPPERKLLELRALMDRCLDILREIQRDLSTAYQEYIVWDYNEYKSKLTQVIESINDVYARDYEAITGTRLPPELRLSFVDDYYKPYLEALRIWRDVFTVRRIRMWTQRWLGWVMYRVAYGVVSKRDIDKLITHVSEKAKLTSEETDFIRQVMDIMHGIAASEYLPTPSTLATLCEYVTLDRSLVEQVFSERRVPDAWRNVWLTYIYVRPIKSDAKALLSAYVRAFRYGVVTRDVVDGYVASLLQYGFTKQEIELITKAIDLEEMVMEARENRREYIPTPSMLASMSEYMVIPDQLVKQVFEARRIPAEWQDIWRRYISVRPIVDDVRGLLTSYRRALVYVAIPDDVKRKIESYAGMIGFTQTEWDILALRVSLEEMVMEARESRREYIPTPMTLATICEYIPDARRFYDSVAKARRIPKEWHELWARYIDIRPLVDDIKRYLSRAETLYVRFMIKRQDFEKILGEVSGYLGYTPKELEFLMKVTEFERYRNAWTELIGSVERLVELSEYSPKAASYALGKLYEMIDALPLSPTEKQDLKAMWEEYIRNRPVKAEAKTYVTQLINLYVDGLISDAAFKKELYEMKKWGFSDNELMFYEAQAALRRARKLRIPIGE